MAKRRFNNEPIPIEPLAEPRIGHVINCEKLNVRSEPDIGVNVVTTITKDSQILVDESRSTDKFYHVSIATGAQGFCMKKYIELEPQGDSNGEHTYIN